MKPDFRSSPPEPLAPLPFDLPMPVHHTLENGLKVIVIENGRLPLVSFRFAFLSGDAHDPKGGTGLTSAVASMLSEGTAAYSSRELAEKVERLGASLSASAGEDFTIVAGSSLSLYQAELQQLLAEVILRPTFPENELDLYRRNTVEHLKFQRSQPGFLAGEQAARLIYGRHPYGTISPKAADIESLERSALVSFHRKTFIPNNALLVVVGDVQSDTLINDLNSLFNDWQEGEAPEPITTVPQRRSSRSLTIVDRPGSAQSNIVICDLGVERTHPDYFPLIVMNQVLGAGASSRVFMNLREEKGYTYGAYTRLDTKRLAGDFEATAEVRTAVTGESLKEFFFELERIRTEDVADEELRDAKNFLTGVFPLRAETQEGLTNLIVNQYLYGLPEDYLQTYRDRIDAITAADVRRVAETHIRPEEMAIVIVGDAEEVLPQARQFADTVEIFNTEGEVQDETKYVVGQSAETVDVSGKWKLDIDFQGQRLSVTMKLEQDGDKASGTLDTMLGSGTIKDAAISGSKITAVASAEMQGQSVEFNISGKVDGDTMSGTITTPIVPDALNFTGSRE